MTRVGLVVVSHSARLAAGVVEVAAQMAPDVTVVPAGGTPDGGIGTDFEAVDAAVDQAEGGAGVVLLYDLGSARMVAEMVVESRADPDRAELVDAPLVEGTVAAAVAAQTGATLAEVATAARSAASVTTAPPPQAPAAPASDATAGSAPAGSARAADASDADSAPVDEAVEETTIRLTNEIGLHARPAAALARTVSEVDASVTVRFRTATADGRSVLALMALGARKGDELTISATGPQATEALRKIEHLATHDFTTPT
jgi:phosphoenolpyruvate---glycerone phosphotransferase subunit DhaM